MILKRIKNYKTFILEILAVFIGITASFWLDDYQTRLEEQNLTEKYLSGFIRDLEADKTQLNNLIDIRNRQTNSSKALLKSIEENTIDVDSFYHHFYIFFPYYKFIPNSNTIEEVLNSSHLRLISDDDLKNRILELRNAYRSIQFSEEHIYQDRSEYLYNRSTLNNIELNGLNVTLEKGSFSEGKDAENYKRDAENFLKDRHFKSLLNLINFNMYFLIPESEAARNECDAIILLLKKQLK